MEKDARDAVLSQQIEGYAQDSRCFHNQVEGADALRKQSRKNIARLPKGIAIELKAVDHSRNRGM